MRRTRNYFLIFMLLVRIIQNSPTLAFRWQNTLQQTRCLDYIYFWDIEKFYLNQEEENKLSHATSLKINSRDLEIFLCSMYLIATWFRNSRSISKIESLRAFVLRLRNPPNNKSQNRNIVPEILKNRYIFLLSTWSMLLSVQEWFLLCKSNNI